MTVRALLLIALLAPALHAQAGATVGGGVRDSIMHAPLIGATVQLVAADNPARFGSMAMSDSSGRYSFAGVPEGRYNLGFFHPVLDSLGVEAPLREIVVQGTRAVRADIATPSASRLQAAICGPKQTTDSAGIVVGVVRDAKELTPISGASVTGDWLEYSFTTTGIVRRMPKLTANTGDNGWFALCNVPAGGMIGLRAQRGGVTTDLIEVQVPLEGFLRRELYIGAARTVVIGDTTRRDSLAPPIRRVMLGDVRISGVVTATSSGSPVEGATVTILGGPQTRTNARGEWTIPDAPSGTRMLEVRGITYYPEHRALDVVSGAPPIRVALSTLKAVLDTVRVTATRIDRDRNGFNERSRAASGRFYTALDLERRQVWELTDVFKLTPGLRLERTDAETILTMRDSGTGGRCVPHVYVDGMFMRNASAEDINGWVRPKDVKGIEIYTGIVPPQFQEALSSCGSIVIWTR